MIFGTFAASAVVVVLLFGTACLSIVVTGEAQVPSSSNQPQQARRHKDNITSSSNVHGVAGRVIKIEGKITNLGPVSQTTLAA